MSALSPQSFRRILAAIIILIPAVAITQHLGAVPARAATSAPLVIGLSDRPEVLAATGTAAGSYLTMTSYVADGATNANLQRWTFELLTPKRTFGYVYLIRNVASGLCMTPNSYFGVYLQSCGSARAWFMQDSGPPAGTGYWLRVTNAGALGECLNADAHPSANPSRINPDSCYPSNVAGERWRVRPGRGVCNTVDVTAFCASFNPPQDGIFANWAQSPVAFTGSAYAQVSQYLGGKTVDDQFFDRVADWFEIGWRTTYVLGNGTTPPSKVQEAYWQEKAPGYNQYYGLSAAPGGNVSDGRNHSYMALRGDAGKVDLLYDYNTVGTTTKSESGRISYVESGVALWDSATATLPASNEHRVQTQDPNGLWHRLPASSTTVVNDRQCYGPSSTQTSAPPNCLVPAVTTVAGPNGFAEVDRVSFAQPAAVAIAGPVDAAPLLSGTPTMLNGVDQAALRDCLRRSPDACLRTVPGLAGCVAARLHCNATAPALASPTANSNRTTLTAAGAKVAARHETLISGRGPLPAKTALTVRSAPARAVLDPYVRDRVAADDTLLVVTSGATVHPSPGETYRGFRATYSARTGRLLEACLGACGLSTTAVTG